MTIKLKRAYDAPRAEDGFRVLVDRLWPRGVSKSSARINLWLKEVAPSATLRQWFAHEPAKWAAFQTRYSGELKEHRDAIAQLLDHARKGTVTLVYAAKDEERNNAVALKKYLESHRSAAAGGTPPSKGRPRNSR